MHPKAHQFIDHLSHEFRTPLTVIKEFATVLGEGLVGEVNPRQRELLDVVHDRADDLATMVSDLLDASRLEAGLLGAWRRVVTVADLVQPVHGMLLRKAAVKKIALRVSLDEGLPEVFCDPDKIGRVIVNLAANAIKFSPEGSEVELWARHNLEEGEVLVGVTDQGPGLSQEQISQVFEPFQEADRPGRHAAKGLGLGLSVARELASLNLAEIEVQSEPGKGSTFAFGVPEANPAELAARYLRAMAKSDQDDPWVTLIAARLAPPVPPGLSNVIDEFLQHTFRPGSLVYRVLPHSWLILTPGAELQTQWLLTEARFVWDEDGLAASPEGLPSIDYQTQGSWPVKTGASEAVHEFRRLLPGSPEAPSFPIPLYFAPQGPAVVPTA